MFPANVYVQRFLYDVHALTNVWIGSPCTSYFDFVRYIKAVLSGKIGVRSCIMLLNRIVLVSLPLISFCNHQDYLKCLDFFFHLETRYILKNRNRRSLQITSPSLKKSIDVTRVSFITRNSVE